ncbi:MAG: inverting alpha,5-L-arabinofuranosidase [Phycisphaerales bacterium]|nr:inverting alpha,5-L-arabinofuranosidase [Phycisphaerales bacterium]
MDGLIDILAKRGADPWVIRHTDGAYYYVQSGGGHIYLRKSAMLAGLATAERKAIWTAPAKGPNSKEVWAPEFHFVDGKWTVYYAADDGKNADHRMFALQCTGDDPMHDRFIDAGQLKLATDHWAIDGTHIQHRGQQYFCWSGWEGREDVRQLLYLQKMKDGLTPVGDRVEISRPTLPWECQGGRPLINEGPEFLSRGGKLHLIYSASGSWSDFYCLGRLTIDAEADLMVAKNWAKHDQPVFASANGIIAPGHCSFVNCAEDEGHPWIIYHCARHFGAGWDRYVRAQRFTWNADDTANFGQPAAPVDREH